MTFRQIATIIRKLGNGYQPKVSPEQVTATIAAIKAMRQGYIDELKAAQEREAELLDLLRRAGDNMQRQAGSLDEKLAIVAERSRIAARIKQTAS